MRSESGHQRKRTAGQRIARKLRQAATHGSRLSRDARRKLYFAVLVTSFIAIWLPVSLLLYVVPPAYTSKWTLILPGTGAGSAVNLESIGQASTSASSPYLSSSVDPRENYKAIVTSQPVLAAAAQAVALEEEQFGDPRIKLLDQTALMEFSIVGDTPEQAQDKAFALYYALQDQLQILRNDEIRQRETGLQRMMQGFSEKLANTQARILSYQSSTGLVSLEQFKELVLTLENLRRQEAELLALQSGVEARMNGLATSLGITPKLAADALLLRNDRLYQELQAEYAEPTAALQEFAEKWGASHPQVVKARGKQQAAAKGLRARSRELLGYADSAVLSVLSIDGADSRAELFRELIVLAAENQGMKQQRVALVKNIETVRQRLDASTDDAAVLEELQRKHQVSTAVFTTALARQDIGKADLYAAYPLVQLLASPSLPGQADTLHKVLAIGAGAIASFLTLFGLFLLWIRKPFLQKILTSA